MLTRQELETAAQRYDDASYPDDIYLDNLQVLREARQPDQCVVDAVTCLFYWKLGKVSLKRTPTSHPLPYTDASGCARHGIGTTGAHRAVMARAVEPGRLETGLRFRGGQLGYEAFKPFASGLTKGSIVLPAFYVHIWRPAEYPILDWKVWQSYCAQQGERVSKTTVPASWADYERYTAFFAGLVASTGLHWRTVDRGLWMLGGDAGGPVPGRARQQLRAGRRPRGPRAVEAGGEV